MNNQEKVKSMIEFIETKEREIQNNSMNADSQIKGDVVKAILDELERVTRNEN
ncbi:hypothetical protein [Mediterraneibacter glycyrrhizinilyticus]|uniref:hypothetical protein n=1 Tax=Mediterraneibacter glycyrrhizinilyticus TaxID=342942 RepID=UPI000B13DD7B